MDRSQAAARVGCPGRVWRGAGTAGGPGVCLAHTPPPPGRTAPVKGHAPAS